MPDDASPRPIAIAVVRNDRDQFLIGQRPEGVVLAGYWEFPGGKLRPGETPGEAAVRECLEETGLAVRLVGAYPDHVQSYPHGWVHLHFFACVPEVPPMPPAPPYRWVARRDLVQFTFPDGNRQLLELLVNGSP